MVTTADKGGRGGQQMVTITDKGGSKLHVPRFKPEH